MGEMYLQRTLQIKDWYPRSTKNFSNSIHEKKRINECWDIIKIKSCCTAKETVKKTKRQPTEWENIFANDTTDKRLVSKSYKELLKLNTRETIKSKNGEKL